MWTSGVVAVVLWTPVCLLAWPGALEPLEPLPPHVRARHPRPGDHWRQLREVAGATWGLASFAERIWTLTRTLGFPSCTPASHTRPWHGSPLNSRGHARYHLKCPPRVLFQVRGRTRSKSGHFLLPLFGSQGAHFPKCFSLCALTSPLQAAPPLLPQAPLLRSPPAPPLAPPCPPP